jgi:methanogenic corrinoid protein MtbC1
MTTSDGSMRIGELAARVGTSAQVLRAWEARYGLLSPSRSVGGYRLYGPMDERRVQAVLAARAEGASAAEACARVLASDRGETPATTASKVTTSAASATAASAGTGRATSAGSGDAGMVADRGTNRGTDLATEIVAALHGSVEAFDEVATQSLVDRAAANLPFDRLLTDVLLPFLAQVGDRWAAGELTVAHEHFASQLIRRRLSGLTMTWGVGTGPIAVLACAPGEFHDIALLGFGLLLGRAGWQVRYLGPNTPLPSLASACRIIDADLVVVAASRSRVLSAYAGGLRLLAQNHPLALGGRGVTAELARDIGADVLNADLTQATAQALDLARRADRPLPQPRGEDQ